MPQDFLLDDDGDLRIENGHFVIGECTNQNKKSLLQAQKGDYRQFPFIGIGIINALDDDEIEDLAGEIQKQYELDGMTGKNIHLFEDGTLTEDYKYED